MKHIRFTKAGFENLKDKYEELKRQRPAAVLELKKARDMGDLSENGYYKATRAKLSSIDYRLRRIAYDLKLAVIVENTKADVAAIGTTVTVASENGNASYAIVGDLESNPSQGKISLNSPLGHALSGKKAGDEIEVHTPAKKIKYKISNISLSNEEENEID